MKMFILKPSNDGLGKSLENAVSVFESNIKMSHVLVNRQP